MRLTETDLRRVIRKLISEVQNLPTTQFTTLPKDEFILVKPGDPLRTTISQELFDIVTQTYAPIGGHYKIQQPSDLGEEYEYWVVADVDEDPEADVGLFGNPRKGGTKLGAAGNDGSKVAKDAYKNYSTTLRKGGTIGGVGNWWGEVGDKPAYAMIKRGAPAIESEEKVRELIGDKNQFQWHGKHPDPDAPDVFKQVNGWYSRKIGPHVHLKIILGNPS